jgi:hypothetical protein
MKTPVPGVLNPDMVIAPAPDAPLMTSMSIAQSDEGAARVWAPPLV